MARRLTPFVRFTAAALAAVIASFVIIGTSAADERPMAADDTAAAGAAPAQAIDVVHPQALKLRYLRCEQAASDGTLDRAGVMSCSVVYEELKHRVFGGSFDALHAWWRQTRDGAAR